MKTAQQNSENANLHSKKIQILNIKCSQALQRTHLSSSKKQHLLVCEWFPCGFLCCQQSCQGHRGRACESRANLRAVTTSTGQVVALGEAFARVLRNRNKGHTLDIIIEGTVLLSVFPQEPEGIVVPKVFKLDESVLAIPREEGKHPHERADTENRTKPACTVISRLQATPF